MTRAQLLDNDDLKRISLILQTKQLEVHVNKLHEDVQGKTSKVIRKLDEKISGNRVDTYGGTQEKILQGVSSIEIQGSDTLTVQKYYSFTHHGHLKKHFGQSSKMINGRATLFRLGSVTSLSLISLLIYCGANVMLSTLRMSVYLAHLKNATTMLMNVGALHETTGFKIERGFNFSFRAAYIQINHDKLRTLVQDGKTYQY